MMFNPALLAALAGFWCAQAVAFEPNSGTDKVLISSEAVSGVGNLTYWGSPEAGSPVAGRSINKRCGSNHFLGCSNTHEAWRDLCNSLVDHLRANPTIQISGGITSVCLTEGSSCCVAWHDNTPSSLKNENLISAAKVVLDNCGGDLVSGKVDDVNLVGKCTSQCMSNRASC